MSYTLIERQELTSAASSISFTGIPQFYTDIQILYSTRSVVDNQFITWTGFNVQANGVSSGYSGRMLEGNGASAYSQTNSASTHWEYAASPDSATTANTFSNGSIYIPNYSGSTAKSYSMDRVTENNATQAAQLIYAGLLSNTAPITSLTFTGLDGNFAAGSSVSLYGINRQQAIGAPKAVGGAISFANGYWAHSFTGSGTFNTKETLDCDYLVVAGGGAGGSAERGGGGGAGGFLRTSARVQAGSYAVTVGSGGAGYTSSEIGRAGNDGSGSAFNLTTPIGGGGGGAGYGVGGTSPNGSAGRNGASGGGGGISGIGGQYAWAGGTGTSGQGNNGGSSGHDHSTYGKCGGGGGAGAVGASITANGQTGNGGAGLSWINGNFYAGGGGGAGDGSNPTGPGGIGGGGNAGTTGSPSGQAGTANTGGGGGGGWFNPNAASGSGGSGIVIIRYKA